MQAGETKVVSLGWEIARASKTRRNVDLMLLRPMCDPEENVALIPAQTVVISGEANIKALRDLCNDLLEGSEGES